MPSRTQLFLPLHLLNHPQAESYNERCNDLISSCEQWSDRCDQVVEERNVARATDSERLPVLKLMEVATKFESLKDERLILLERTDELALEISEMCGYEWSIRLAEVVRRILEKELIEMMTFLTMWVQPEDSLEAFLKQCMDVRVLLSLALALKAFSAADVDGEGLEAMCGSDQVDSLIRRLTYCPVARLHYEKVSKEQPEYGLMRLAKDDAAQFEGELYKEHDPRAKGIRVTEDRKLELRMGKAWIVQSIGHILRLTHAPECAHDCLEVNKKSKKPVSDRVRVRAMRALTGFKSEFHFTDFQPNLPEDLAKVELVKYSRDDVKFLAKRLGYGSIHETMQPDDDFLLPQ